MKRTLEAVEESICQRSEGGRVLVATVTSDLKTEAFDSWDEVKGFAQDVCVRWNAHETLVAALRKIAAGAQRTRRDELTKIAHRALAEIGEQP